MRINPDDATILVRRSRAGSVEPFDPVCLSEAKPQKKHTDRRF